MARVVRSRNSIYIVQDNMSIKIRKNKIKKIQTQKYAIDPITTVFLTNMKIVFSEKSLPMIFFD